MGGISPAVNNYRGNFPFACKKDQISQNARMVRNIVVAASCIALGLGLGAAKWRGSAKAFHREARMAAILDQARQMPAGGVVVIGDSTAEFNRFDSLCGLPALNAGIAWSTPQDWLGDAPKVIQAARPSIVVLALGSNLRHGWQDSFRTLANLSEARFAVAPRDRQAAAFIATVLPLATGAKSYRDDKHPDAKGAAEWRASIDAACLKYREASQTGQARPK